FAFSDQPFFDEPIPGSPPKCPAIDPLDHTVLLPNPDDCPSFFMCSNGVPILQKCPEGLHYNAHLDVCDWPESAGCELVSPDPDPEGGVI
ncbi:MAG: chitin binding domain-containing protein, partial [Bacteroidales bacterium]|nr:chitin binding domain-containing protein [Bacteroidales bacterium]